MSETQNGLDYARPERSRRRIGVTRIVVGLVVGLVAAWIAHRITIALTLPWTFRLNPPEHLVLLSSALNVAVPVLVGIASGLCSVWIQSRVPDARGTARH